MISLVDKHDVALLPTAQEIMSDPSDTAPSAAALTRFFRVGLPCAVADQRGACVELRPKIVTDEVVVATARESSLWPGARVSGRIFTEEGVQVLTLEVEEVERTLPGRMDVLARVVEFVDRGDERRAPRVAFDSAGTAILSETLECSPESKPVAIRIADVSPAGVAFLSDRRFDRGDIVDLSFGDDAAGTIRCRCQVLRAERAVYGRTRFAALITAIGELDQLRLDRLVSRCRLRDEARRQEQDDVSVRELLAGARGQRGLRRIIGRAS
jgi:hypothetical protein